MVTNLISFSVQRYSFLLGKTINASPAILFLSIFKDMTWWMALQPVHPLHGTVKKQ